MAKFHSSTFLTLQLLPLLLTTPTTSTRTPRLDLLQQKKTTSATSPTLPSTHQIRNGLESLGVRERESEERERTN